jgi:hypothetical protein
MKRFVCVASLTMTTLFLAVPAQPQQTSAPPAAPQRPALPPPPTPKTGNPTPGTPQPNPPNVADRITVSGCLQLAAGAGAAPPSAATTPASDRYVLQDTRKDGTYRLEALESQLSPFAGARVELSGEVKTPAQTPPVLLVEFVRKTAAKCQ